MRIFVCLLFVLSASVSAFGDDISRAVFREVNLARTQPQVYASIIASRASAHRGPEGQSAIREAINFLKHARPLPALDFSTAIALAAADHVEDQSRTARRGHYGSDRSAPWDRMDRYGDREGRAGENIHYGRTDARGVVVALIVDDGVRGRGHRKNIFSSGFGVVGVAGGSHPKYGRMCVMDFAGGFDLEGSQSMASNTRMRSPWTAARGMF